jgi:hypothetical protein
MSKRTAKAKIGNDVFELHEDRRTLVINGGSRPTTMVSSTYKDPQMRESEKTHNRLQSVSNAVGIDLNTVDPDALDQVLAENHAHSVELVPDGSVLDVSLEEYQSRIIEIDQLVDEFGTNAHEKAALQRSGLIRKHMMAAKIEDRIIPVPFQ